MKKLFALLLALVMALSLVACGEKKDDTGGKTDDSNPSTGMELTQATDLVIATGAPPVHGTPLASASLTP